MGVGHEDCLNPAAIDQSEQSVDVVLVCGSGINDGQVLPADEIGISPRPSHRAGIAPQYTLYRDAARAHLDGLSRYEIRLHTYPRCPQCGTAFSSS